MKITKRRLQRIISEEKQRLRNESEFEHSLVIFSEAVAYKNRNLNEEEGGLLDKAKGIFDATKKVFKWMASKGDEAVELLIKFFKKYPKIFKMFIARLAKEPELLEILKAEMGGDEAGASQD